MPSSSSRTAVLFKRPLTNARLAVHDGPGGARPTPGGFGLKEIQRRAFERGVAVEREKGSRSFAALCVELKKAIAAQQAARAQDRERAEEFAVRLALAVAEKLTRRIVEAEEHDVAGLVKELFQEMGGNQTQAGSTIRVSAADQGLLLEGAGRGEIDLDGIEVKADPQLRAGSIVIESGKVEYWSELNDRIERVRETLLTEARDVGV